MSVELIKPGVNFDFIGNRRWAFLFSGILIAASLVSVIAHKGLNLGVDFQGGSLIQARFASQSADPESVRATLSDAGLRVSSVQDYGEGGEREYLINIQNLEGTGDQALSSLAIAALKAAFGEDGVEIRRQEMVGPRVGADLRQKALYAVYYSVLIIIIYISGRFEQKWGTSLAFSAILLGIIYVVSLFGVGVGTLIITALIVTCITCYFMRFSFALGGIIALMHDVIITTGVFSFLNKEITLSFVAAILTIIGYSLNDSIIVFDRIRENRSRNRRGNYPEIINRSINETLSRTILTSGTTLFALLSLYFLGGPVNQDFALALTIGIAIGTFSSIFIASPILLLWESKAGPAPDAGTTKAGAKAGSAKAGAGPPKPEADSAKA
ncbi:MAG: protein translocase subunit SecF [Deltaproteobacteria bacterium]|jgi:preprotein translocase subunit SecF|nr:protein translocase subunit SecF [Deltaproteobacteria bacterium]